MVVKIFWFGQGWGVELEGVWEDFSNIDICSVSFSKALILLQYIKVL